MNRVGIRGQRCCRPDPDVAGNLATHKSSRLCSASTMHSIWSMTWMPRAHRTPWPVIARLVLGVSQAGRASPGKPRQV
jgi:hypothetical protein